MLSTFLPCSKNVKDYKSIIIVWIFKQNSWYTITYMLTCVQTDRWTDMSTRGHLLGISFLFSTQKYQTRQWKNPTVLTEWTEFTVIYCSQDPTSDLLNGCSYVSGLWAISIIHFYCFLWANYYLRNELLFSFVPVNR